MIRWRLTIGFLLLLLVGIPLAAPLWVLLQDPSAWQSWAELSRLGGLLRNTLFLIAGTLALAMPLGIAGAILLYRTDLPGRRLWRLLTLLTLFVPLPLFTSGWQAVLGSGGWLPVPVWSGSAGVWTPWGQGIGSAIWIHALAGVPWVILLTGQGLLGVERDLEEDARTVMPSWRVLLRVTLPRSAASIAAAALWVSLQVATEITVTDVMQVRTFAEEVYTQIVGGPYADEGVARAVAVTLPSVLLFAVLVVFMVRGWELRIPMRATLLSANRNFNLRLCRWPLAMLAATSLALVLAMPLGSLVWRTGRIGSPPAWSIVATGHYLWRACQPPDGRILAESILSAVVAGLLVSSLALLTCWAARGCRWFLLGMVLLMAVAWAMPGPLVGLGLKSTILVLLEMTHSKQVAEALYHGPSLVPLIWVDLIRFFPCAIALLWPVVRLLPVELSDAARTDGATPTQELRHVYIPLLGSAFARAALVVAILSLGELSASKLVATPGSPGFATDIFTQMHYGVTNELAARCVLLLLLVLLGGFGVFAFARPNHLNEN